MPWTDRLFARAVYRDFEFLTDSHDSKAGRRLVVHEYPGKDIPLVEDFGQKSGEWSLSAYFVGVDYDIPRNEFLRLLNEPGPDWLYHPWLGPLWVRAASWSVSESNDKGGYCAVKVEFVAGGEVAPEPAKDLDDLAQAACEEAAVAAVEEFDLQPMSADAFGGFVAAVNQRLEGLRNLLSLATLPLSYVSQAMNMIASVKTEIAALVALPRAYANAMLSIVNQIRGLGNSILSLGSLFDLGGLFGGGDSGSSSRSGRRIAPDIRPADRAAIVERIAKAADTSRAAVTLTGASTADTALHANLRAEYALEQRLLACTALSIAVGDYPSESERDRALDAVDRAVIRVLPLTPDEVFQPLVTARAAVITALLDRDYRPTIRRDIAHPLPSALIAHNLGVEEDVFLARNAVRHPLFVNGVVYG